MRVLIAGLGGIGQRHLRNLRTLLGPEASIAAYRVRGLSHTLTDQLEIEADQDVRTKYGVEVYRDLSAAMDSQPTAALICNPTSLHVPVALRLARAGCHLFMEKPLSHSMEDVDELLRVAEQRRLVTLMGYQLRFHPCVQKLRAWVQEHRVGRLLAVRAEVGEYLPGWHRYEDYREMYASREELGGGVVLSQIHELDYLGWIFGWPRRIFAMGGHLSGLDINVEDTASLLMGVPQDGREIPVHVHMDYLQQPASRTCQVLGDAGKILLDLRAATVTRWAAGGEVAEVFAVPDFPRNQLFLDELAHFLRCLAGEDASRVPLSEGVKSLSVALAAKASLASGQPLNLEL